MLRNVEKLLTFVKVLAGRCKPLLLFYYSFPKIKTTFFEIASMKSERELESVGTTTIPRLDNNASGIVLIVFLTKDDLTA